MAVLPAPTCPDSLQLECLADGTADSALQDQFRDHLLSCALCGEEMTRIRAENGFLREVATVVRDEVPLQSRVPGATTIPGYTLLGELQRGGQGVVYRAIQRSTRREVAIKVMREGPFAGRIDQTRFEREVQILAQLNHPNIVTIHDSGVAAGSSYFVMDLVHGKPLDDYADDGDHLNAAERAAADHDAPARARAATRSERRALLVLFAKICEAVNAAHLRGVIHRDLKPRNVLVDESGEPFVLDFGLARIASAEADSAATLTGHFVGSLHWASPEQLDSKGGRLDLRSDVYSLGLILYRVLTGRLPFDESGPLPGLIVRIQAADPIPPSRLSAGIDIDLETIILRCLAKQPDQRYETAGALARDVRHYLAGEPIDARRDSILYLASKVARRHALAISLAGGALLVLLAFAITMSVLYRRATDAEQASSASARRLAGQLSISTFERGRMLGLVGSVALAEDLLWREFLTVSVQAPGIASTDPAFWALLELYSRHPCLETIKVSEPPAVHRILSFAGSPPLVQVGCENGWIERWNIETRQRLAHVTLDPLARPVFWGVSQDGARLLATTDDTNELMMVYLPAGIVCPLDIHVEPRAGCALNREGDRLVYNDDAGMIRIDDIDSAGHPHERFRFDPRPGVLRRFSFTSDSQALTCSGNDRSIEVWDLIDPEPTLRWQRLDASHTTFAVSPDDEAVVFRQAGDDCVVFASMRDGTIRTRAACKSGLIGAIAHDPLGERVVIAGSNATDFSLIAVSSGLPITSLLGHRASPCFPSFSPDGRQVASVASDGLVKIWDVPRDGPAAKRIAHVGTVHCVAFGPQGEDLICAAHDGRVWATPLHGQGIRMDISAHQKPAASVAVSPRGDHFVTAGHDGAVRLWDAKGKLLATLNSSTSWEFVAAVFHRDGERVAAACEDSLVYVWNTTTREHKKLAEHGERVATVAYSPDGRWLASGDRKGKLIVRDAATLEVKGQSKAHSKVVRTLAFSPDSQLLATGGDDCLIKFWRVPTGDFVNQLEGHQQQVFALCFRPDGKLIASGDANGAIVLWDVAERRSLLQLDRHSSAIFSLAFSPTGERLASGSSDRTAQVHDLAYMEHFVAGNLEVALDRLNGEVHPQRARELQSWAAEVTREFRRVER